MPEELTCPVHKSRLVERKGRFGSFFGCPLFSDEEINCRYVHRPPKENDRVFLKDLYDSLTELHKKVDAINAYINERRD